MLANDPVTASERCLQLGMRVPAVWVVFEEPAQVKACRRARVSTEVQLHEGTVRHDRDRTADGPRALEPAVHLR